MSSTVWIGLLLAGLAAVVSAAVPGERFLDRSVGIVYLHGAWVWTSLAAFAAAALAGLVGLTRRSRGWQLWSTALGQAGAVFWFTYLPLSLLAMRATWGGLYLLEPRWRLGVDFAVVALMAQVGLLILDRPGWASAVNVGFFAALALALTSTPAVLHPTSPVFRSDVLGVKLAFLTILGLCLGAAVCLARLLRLRRA
jgi:hypothetical protein